MKTCVTCHTDKNDSDYGVNKAMPDGRNRICKSCNNRTAAYSRLIAKNPEYIKASDKLNAHQRKSIGALKYETRNRNPNEALPRQIDIMAAKDLETERDIPQTYCRNDGNKHIKSLGF